MFLSRYFFDQLVITKTIKSIKLIAHEAVDSEPIRAQGITINNPLKKREKHNIRQVD